MTTDIDTILDDIPSLSDLHGSFCSLRNRGVSRPRSVRSYQQPMAVLGVWSATMTTTNPAARLAELAAALEAGEQPDPEAARALAAGELER